MLKRITAHCYQFVLLYSSSTYSVFSCFVITCSTSTTDDYVMIFLESSCLFCV